MFKRITCSTLRHATPALALILMTGSPASAAPGAMSVATFLAKVAALRALGPAAVFSSDVNVLKQEGLAGALAYKAQLEAERKAGQPSSCPPDPPQVTGEEVIAQMNSYPANMRGRILVRQAFADVFRKRYPCHK